MSTTRIELLTLVEHFGAGNEPVSFYDAMLLVRRARRVGELEDPIVGALLTLHDNARITDGGRAVLADFLKGLAQAQAQERALGQRIVRPKDTGKVARGKIGASIKVALADNGPGSTNEWQVVELTGPARIEILSPARASELKAAFELKLLDDGTVVIELTKYGGGMTPSSSARSSAPPQTFRLRVLVDK